MAWRLELAKRVMEQQEELDMVRQLLERRAAERGRLVALLEDRPEGSGAAQDQERGSGGKCGMLAELIALFDMKGDGDADGNVDGAEAQRAESADVDCGGQCSAERDEARADVNVQQSGVERAAVDSDAAGVGRVERDTVDGSTEATAARAERGEVGGGTEARDQSSAERNADRDEDVAGLGSAEHADVGCNNDVRVQCSAVQGAAAAATRSTWWTTR